MKIKAGSELTFYNATITIDGKTSDRHKELVVKLEGEGETPNLTYNFINVMWKDLGRILLFISHGEVNGQEVSNKRVVISTRKRPKLIIPR
ncbi:hypothetical protein [Shimazuella alba]|uniref:Uncharacterized protein n=1 Tax=Shimazuella alba TaxID=2690964 RepID=A0A6I4VYK5_9BACL|nr:hypothetical protein [Shimazuella alba]MXQ54856.1 hypothetical protein [Shimazuella alba]